MSKWLAGFMKESKISVVVESSYIVFHIFNPVRDYANSFFMTQSLSYNSRLMSINLLVLAFIDTENEIRSRSSLWNSFISK